MMMHRFIRLSAILAGISLGLGTIVPSANAAPAQPTGAQWRLVTAPPGSGPSQYTGVSASSDRDVWAVGSQDIDPKSWSGRPLAAHFDGRRWTEVKVPGKVGLYSVTAVNPREVWALRTGSEPGATAPEVLRYDGNRWATVRLAPVGAGKVFPRTLHVFAPNNIWVVGYVMDDVKRTSRGFSQHFDGRSWKAVEIPTLGKAGLAISLTVTGGQTWIAGCSGNFGDGDAYFARLDGKTWRPVPGPAGSECAQTAAVLPDGRLLTATGNAARTNAAANPSTARTIAGHTGERQRPATGNGWKWTNATYAWNGKAWQEYKAPLANGVLNKLNSDGRGGVWGLGVDQEHPNVARFDGKRWTKIALGASLAQLDAHLFNGVQVGGSTSQWAVGQTNDFLEFTDATKGVIARYGH